MGLFGNEFAWNVAMMMVGLFLFGVLYNEAVSWMERHGYDTGYTAFMVVVGVAVTVAACLPLIGWPAVIVLLLGFAASGTPMVLGSVARYQRERRRAEETLRRVAEDEVR